MSICLRCKANTMFCRCTWKTEEELTEKVLRAYKEGYLIKNIIHRFGAPRFRINNILKKAGINPNQNASELSQNRTDPTPEEIEEMKKQFRLQQGLPLVPDLS